MAAFIALVLMIFALSVVDLIRARRRARRDAWLSLEDEHARRQRLAAALRPPPCRADEP